MRNHVSHFRHKRDDLRHTYRKVLAGTYFPVVLLAEIAFSDWLGYFYVRESFSVAIESMVSYRMSCLQEVQCLGSVSTYICRRFNMKILLKPKIGPS